MSATPITVRSEVAAAPVARPSVPGWLVMWRVEVAKMASQVRMKVIIPVCVLAPVVFVLAESVQTAVPSDTLFGRWVHESGFAVSLLMLGYCGLWALPFAIGILAGDACSEEDRYRTWSLLLTRSRSRGDVLIGKILSVGTYSVAVTVLLGASSTVTGIVAVGTQPVVGLSGTMLSPGAALQAAVTSWASELAPILAIASLALLISVLSRNSWVGVMGTVGTVLVLNLVSMLSAIDPIRPYLPTTGLQAWHGLARTDVYTNQVWTSVLVSAGWIVLCLGLTAGVFLRRDVVDA
jgi:ABC-2 type transport system permease protein